MKKAIYILCIILLLIQVMGCDAQLLVDQVTPNGEGNEDADIQAENEHRGQDQFTVLYFLDPLGAYLFPLSFAVPEGTSVQELAKHLSAGPIRKEWGQSPLPGGISIADIDVTGELVRINLKASSSFPGFEADQEELLVRSLVYTLTSFAGIEAIEFLQGSDKPGMPFELLARQNFFTRADLDLNPLEKREGGSAVRLWFSSKDVLYMVPVSHYPDKIPQGIPDLALLLVNALIEGPGDYLPLLKPFPDGAEVLSVRVVDQTLEIDFNRLFVENFSGGSAQEWAILNSLVLTLTEIPGIQEVQILVEGRKEAAALGHIDTTEPLVRGVVNWVLAD